MVKVFYLGLFAAIICALAALTLAVPVGSTVPRNSSMVLIAAQQPQSSSSSHASSSEAIFSDDSAIRSERSTNLSHITGSARKIQMYVKNRHLQILPDGTVNGTSDDTSDYTILQRTTVNIGQLKIQGVATCQFLCMDSCGLLYGSREFLDECIFNEMIEQHHYNTYSSARYSNKRRTMYLALNRRGQPRKVQIRVNQQLGKLSTYTRVLTKTVTNEVLEDMVTRLLHHNSGEESSTTHPLRHHGGHLCPTFVNTDVTKNQQRNKNLNTSGGIDTVGIDKLRCRKRKKRKKKRRKCELDENAKGCQPKPFSGVSGNVRKNISNNNNNNNNNNKTRECDKNNNKCQRLDKSVLVTVKKNRKLKLDEKQLNLRNVKRNGGKKQLNNNNNNNNKNVKKLLVQAGSKPKRVNDQLVPTNISISLLNTSTTSTTSTTTTTSVSAEENFSCDESTTVTIDNSEILCDKVTSTPTLSSDSETESASDPDNSSSLLIPSSNLSQMQNQTTL